MAAGALEPARSVVAIVVRRRARSSSRASAARCTCRAPTGYLPRAALGALVAPLFVDAVPHRAAARGARAARRARSSSSRAGATRACPRSRAPANPARELARRIGRTIPLDLRRRRARRGRGDALEVRRQRERQGARVLEHVPRARPQRDLRRGASTATSPASSSRSSSCATASSTSGSRPRFDATRELIEECVAPGARGARPRARAGSRSCSTSCTSATG